MLATALAFREPWLSKQAFRLEDLLSWSGGVFGAIYIAVSILLFPRLGAATVIALIVAGQMVGSLLFDHFGLLGAPLHPVTVSRAIGGALLIAAVVLIRL